MHDVYIVASIGLAKYELRYLWELMFPTNLWGVGQ